VNSDRPPIHTRARSKEGTNLAPADGAGNKVPEPALLLVTDRKQSRAPLARVVDEALAAGCRWLSLRERDVSANEQLALARCLRSIARHRGARVTVHGDAAIAKEAGLDGAHLRAGADIATARALLGGEALIGVSVHSVIEAERLDPGMLDYAIVGPVYETASKPGYGPALGPAGLAAFVRATPVPIIAIGGIEPRTVADVMASGAAGVAVMGPVMRADAPARVIGQLLAALAASRGGQRA
jgi:thiamine-phosphate pyrophosphorylase